MKVISKRPKASSRQSEPTWDIAYLFPAQGNWSEEEYLELDGNRLIELSHGHLEVLPMPTTSHQVLVLYLYGLLQAFNYENDLGTLLVAPLRVRLWRGKFREPDVVFMLRKHASRVGEEFWSGADLVMEVVSGKGSKEDRGRDLIVKRREYARAGIPEYWIVDPWEENIVVLKLIGKKYHVHGEFRNGTKATSKLLEGFVVDVTKAFAPHVRSSH